MSKSVPGSLNFYDHALSTSRSIIVAHWKPTVLVSGAAVVARLLAITLDLSTPADQFHSKRDLGKHTFLRRQGRQARHTRGPLESIPVSRLLDSSESGLGPDPGIILVKQCQTSIRERLMT